MNTLLIQALMALGLFAVGTAFGYASSASAAGKCFPLASLKISHEVVVPEAKQMVLEGKHAKAYLHEYNTYGRWQTHHKGTVLFIAVAPSGKAFMTPLNEGKGCKRLIVGPKLHRQILATIGIGES